MRETSYPPAKVLISAGETSSDIHGAVLLEALRDQLKSEGKSLQAFGIGGPSLQAAGLDAIVDTRELMVMGFVPVLKHIPRLFGILGRTVKSARERKPELAIVIDYPDFHLRLAKRLKRLGIPVIYYIPPKVWAWRKNRLRLLRKNFQKILCILPFEESFYRSQGISAKYVGNPLMDELPFDLSKEIVRKSLGLSSTDRVVVVMPGSRSAELKRHIPLMREACELLAEKLAAQGWISQKEKLQILVPFPSTVGQQEFLSTSPLLTIHVSRGNAWECLLAADVGMIKSGTSTLEAGLLGCPHFIVYRADPISTWIYKSLVRYSGKVGLVNLVSGSWVKELLLEKATPTALSEEAFRILTDLNYRMTMLEGFKGLRLALGGSSSSTVTADTVLGVLGQGPSAAAAREIISSLKGE